MKHTTLKNLSLILVVSLLSATGAVLISNKISPQKEVIVKESQAIAQYASMPVSPAINTDFTVAAEKAVDAVVHVTVLVETEAYYGNSIFDFFFGDGEPQTYKRQQMGSGSGVIISKDGYIVTNNHVIDKSQKIRVKFNDKREFSATLVGSDPVTDIALIKIDNAEEEEFPTLDFGNSESLKIGEWVLAIGNPFSLSTTVTAGIVSAKGRNMYNMHRQNEGKINIESFIQTDAAVNPGNSGGALVNTNGELIGINTAIASPTGAYAGYSFAVPSTIVKKVVTDLMEFGEIKRGYIGVSISDINEQLAKDKDLNTLNGAYVGGLSEDGAAKEAGIKEGDVIIAVNNIAVNSMSELQEQVSRYRPGDKITATVMRGEKEKQYILTLRDEYGNNKIMPNKAVSTLGAELAEIPEQLKEELGISAGVQVKALNNGKLKSKGMKAGYIITKINNQMVESVDDVKKIVRTVQGGLFITGLYPNGNVAYFAINMDE